MTTSTMVETTASQQPDSEAVMKVLLVLAEHSIQRQQRKQQQQQQSKDVDVEQLETLDRISTPRHTVDLLASRLFAATATPPPSSQSGDGGDADAPRTAERMDSRTALAALASLVTLRPEPYLAEASRAVRTAAESLQTPPSSSADFPSIEVSDEVLDVVSSQLSSPNVEVSSNACITLVALCRALPPLTDSAIGAICRRWTEVAGSDADPTGTISIRCASASADIAVLSDAAMRSFLSRGAGGRIESMLADRSDPLLRMSVVDVVERMATTLPMHGERARWLYSIPVLGPLLDMAGGGDPDAAAGGDGPPPEPDPILGGPALRTLSSLFKLGQRDAALFGLAGGDGGAEHQALLRGFRRALYNFDSTGTELGRLAFVDAASSFASASTDALTMVLDDPLLREGWMNLASVAQPRLKAVVLTSVARVIDPPVEVDGNGDRVAPDPASVPSNPLAMRLFQTLGEVNNRDPTDLLLQCAKEPIVETRLGAYELMRAVAKRGRGGAHVLLSHEDFYDFLVDREVEKTKEGKEAKFAIIDAMLESDVVPMLADDVVKTLEELKRQGPHYVKVVPWEMATE